MLGKYKAMLVAVPLGLMLGGCSEITEYFVAGNPAEVSSCDFVDTDVGLEGALCVECNSGDASTASASACGVSLSVRCNSTGDNVFGIAIGGIDEGQSFLTGTAWVDDDGTWGPSADDSVRCHEQSLDTLGKQEWKCTDALKGNGKDATTFEASIKYDASKDTCGT